MNEQEERDLIIEARGGDSRAFDQLARHFDRFVLSQALNFTRDREKALDVYQEVFLRAHRSLGQFRFDCRFSSWLRQITANVCLSEYAKEKRREKTLLVNSQISAEGENDWSPVALAETSTPDSYRQAVSREIRGKIEQVIMELPPQQRMVFVLRHYEGQKIKDIADLLDIALGTAKKHLFVAVQKMRDNLKEFQGIA
ncbi:MAG: sigma-70 family RNA polymerase sigma factor [Acidobacteriota bacterium]